MSRTVIGLFDEFRQAEAAVRELESLGVPQSSISVVANNANNEYTTWRDDYGKNYGTSPAGQGAEAGTALGAIGGIALGLGLLVIPGLGPLAAAGPLIAGLTGAGVGAATGGLIGKLTDLGVPEEHAGYFTEGIRRGGTLVTVSSADNMVEQAIEILNRNGAVDINQRASYYQQTGYAGYNANTAPYTSTELTAERERIRAATMAAAPAMTGRMEETRTATSMNTMPATTQSINTQGETVLPVVEESIALGKREVQSGGVRVYTRVTEKPVEESINLREEHVTVERRSVDRPINAADMAAFKEGTIEVTERAEVPVISKEARIVEEVVVGKQATERTETVRDTVRRTDVEVEQMAGQNMSGHTGRFADYSSYEQNFRSNFQSTYGNTGSSWEQYQPAYQYGYNLSSDARYRGRDWNSIQSDLQRDWETRQPGTWNRFSNSIRYAWEQGAQGSIPGVQTGGHALDGTPDTRGLMEKAADTLTRDRIDDKTGKVV